MIPKLEVDGVSYSYHSLDGETLALDHISFDVSPGEFLAIVGPSGCGKSTLLSMLCGLTQPEGCLLYTSIPHHLVRIQINFQLIQNLSGFLLHLLV